MMWFFLFLLVDYIETNCLFNFLFPIFSEGKISPDEPAILPPLPIVPKNEKRKFLYGTPQPKRVDYRDRDWDRERDRDFELMPPPGSHRKDFATPLMLINPLIQMNPHTVSAIRFELLVLYFYIFNSFQNHPLYINICNYGQCLSYVLKCCNFLNHSGILWRHDCLWQWKCESLFSLYFFCSLVVFWWLCSHIV